MKNPLILILTGPTASGKTDLANRIRSQYPVDIISADSRQIYRGLNIGTGKDQSFPQAMIDIIDPPTKNISNSLYTASDFATDSKLFIEKSVENRRVPLIVGGTGFYLESIIFKKPYNNTPPNQKMRDWLNNQNNQELLDKIKKLDPRTYHRIDHNNRHRIIRACEILLSTGETIKPSNRQERNDYNVRVFVIAIPRIVLYENINQRVDTRIKEGMIDEVRSLLASGVSSDWLIGLGLEYRWITFYLSNLITYDTMVQRLKSDIHRYARQQISFFKRWPNAIYGESAQIFRLMEKEISTGRFREGGDDEGDAA